MIDTDRYAVIAARLREVLGEGMDLNGNVVQTLDSLISPASGAELTDAVGDGDKAESQTILELICFPDEKLQAKLEPLLADANLEPADAEQILARLSHPPPTARFTFPDGRGTAEVQLPESAAAAFLDRLHIDRNPDPRLVDAVAAGAPPDRQALFRAKLRNCRFRWSEPRINFLQLFFQNIDFVARDPERLLDFTLSLFHELPDTPDLWSAVSAKKQDYVNTLEKAARFEEQRRGQNMETLSMQGVRIPHVDAADIGERLELIDALCLAVFGLTPPVEQTAEVNLGPIEGDEDLKRMIRMLS